MRRLGLVFALILLAGCFDPPVKETLRLRFYPNGLASISNAVELDLLAGDGKNPELTRRMTDLRRELLEGLDPWAQRFEDIEPVSERLSWEKRVGLLYSARRSALIEDPASLRDLFSHTALSVSYTVGEDGLAELAIAPGVPSQATRRQRKDVERALDEWSGHVAGYLAATGDLYAWLEDNPGRAEPCLAQLFNDLIEETGEKEELSPGERERIGRVQAAMEKVLDVLVIPKGQDRSMDELSHLVYDPFPAPLTIQLPGAPLEVEGFEPSGEEEKKDNVWKVDNPGLWAALRSLEGRWISPDLVQIYVGHKDPNGKGLDLGVLLDLPRTYTPPMPNSLEVKRAIEERLKPSASVYRAVWQALPKEEADEAELSWEED